MAMIRDYRRGFTLTELMLVIAILGFIAMIGPLLYTQFRHFFFLNFTRVTILRESRNVESIITDSLRKAKSSKIAIDNAADQPFYSRITFNDITEKITYVIYQRGKNLIFSVNGNEKILSSNLKTLLFTLPRYDDLSTVSYKVVFEKGTVGNEFKTIGIGSKKLRVMNP